MNVKEREEEWKKLLDVWIDASPNNSRAGNRRLLKHLLGSIQNVESEEPMLFIKARWPSIFLSAHHVLWEAKVIQKAVQNHFVSQGHFAK